MANQEHVDILKHGVEAWNKWREENRTILPDLSEAKLSEVDLSRANLSGVNFIGADLQYADLSNANLTCAADLTNVKDLSRIDLSRIGYRPAHLSNANLHRCDLNHANLYQAYLKHVDLSNANLLSSDISFTDLTEANMCKADLTSADLSYARLINANLYQATIGYTTFGNVDLRSVKGLETIIPAGPSTIGINTIMRSKGRIPEIFLRKVGIPESVIENIPALVNAMKPIDFYSCFISYSSRDQLFAERLYNDLQGKGVRCWYAPEDLKAGDKFWHRIDESIRLYDKLLVILSKNSVESPWVENEVMAAIEKEHNNPDRTALFPIRIDEAIMETPIPWAASFRRSRHILDFTKWKRPEQYQKALEKLLKDLNK